MAPTPLIVLLCVFVISMCGMGYELLAGTITSYFLGNSVLQFSLTIGFFLFAMGIGSFLSGKVRDDYITVFLAAELVLSLAGGCFSLLLFSVYTFAPDNFYTWFIAAILATGTIIGLEIPLLIRLLKNYGDLNLAVANVLSFDYIGALAASILFPLFILPHLGIMQASFLFGLLNISAAFLFIGLMKDQIPGIGKYTAAACLIAAVLFTGLLTSFHTVGFFENMLFARKIILSKQTPFQKIVVTKRNDDIRLFLDGHLQFCSIDEYRYHEALVHPALSMLPGAENVLILGGGDGLAAREVLKYSHIKKITLVDLDREVVEICSSNNILSNLNENALKNPKVHLVTGDAFKFVENDSGLYDAILIDLPDPSTESIAKLYSLQFYRMTAERLSRRGILVTQATSPFFSNSAYWCIYNTLSAAGLKAKAMQVNVPSFGEWGFVAASQTDYDFRHVQIRVPVRYVTTEMAPVLFTVPKDMQYRETRISTVNNPEVMTYYVQGEPYKQ